jgi:hypothetical protein
MRSIVLTLLVAALLAGCGRGGASPLPANQPPSLQRRRRRLPPDHDPPPSAGHHHGQAGQRPTQRPELRKLAATITTSRVAEVGSSPFASLRPDRAEAARAGAPRSGPPALPAPCRGPAGSSLLEWVRNLSAAKDALATAEQVIADHGPQLTLAYASVLFEHAELARARGDTTTRATIRGSATGSPTKFLATSLPSRPRCRNQSEIGPRSGVPTSPAVADRGRVSPQGAAACLARMITSLWLVRGGRPPRWPVVRCQRDGYGFELQRL